MVKAMASKRLKALDLTVGFDIKRIDNLIVRECLNCVSEARIQGRRGSEVHPAKMIDICGMTACAIHKYRPTYSAARKEGFRMKEKQRVAG